MARRKTICAECKHYRVTVPFLDGVLWYRCVATAKQGISLVTGKELNDITESCAARNNGRCKYFKEARS